MRLWFSAAPFWRWAAQMGCGSRGSAEGPRSLVFFTDGAVIGSRSFVNEAFANARERFEKARKDGARKMRGDASAAAGY